MSATESASSRTAGALHSLSQRGGGKHEQHSNCGAHASLVYVQLSMYTVLPWSTRMSSGSYDHAHKAHPMYVRCVCTCLYLYVL